MTIHLAYSREKRDGKVCGGPERIRMEFVLVWDTGTGTYEVIGRAENSGSFIRIRVGNWGESGFFPLAPPISFRAQLTSILRRSQPSPCCPGRFPGAREKKDCTIAPPARSSEHQ